MANQEQLEIIKQGAEVWNSWRKVNPEIKIELSGAFLPEVNLSRVNLAEADLDRVYLTGADLSKANLSGARLWESRLVGANLAGANLAGANLSATDLSGADLSEAYLSDVSFTRANLTGVNLSNTVLTGAGFIMANLSEAKLCSADLSMAILIRTNLDQANLSEAKVYGASVWDTDLNDTMQNNLIITPPGHSEITVDNLEVAQFIYLILKNEKIRNVIDTIGNKGVLILGRFTKERKAILDSIREKLRALNYVPMMFDFEKPTKKDLTETVQLLANMSKFVIADITEAKSIPQELSHIIPNFPSVPVQPIILSSERAYAIFEHWEHFNSVLPVFKYDNEQQLFNSFKDKVILPVENWDKEQNEMDRLRAENEELRRKLDEK